MPLKIAGCALVVVVSFCVGWLLSLRLYRRKSCLERLSVFVGLLMTEIRFSAADIFTLVNSAAHASELDFLVQIREDEQPFPKLWEQSVTNIPRKFGLLNSDKELLLGLGNELGKSDVEGQLCYLNLFSGMLSLALEDARNNLTGKSKLYKAMGFFIGATIALIVI